MSTIDYILLFAYLLGIFIISVVSSGRINNQKDMFSAGGRAPWWTSGLSSFMTVFSAGTFVVWGGIAYRYGIVAITINLCIGIAALLVGFFVAGRWHKLGVTTPASYLQLRFGNVGINLYTWTMMLKELIAIGIAIYSLAIILVALIPLEAGHILRDPSTGNLSLTWAIIIFGGTVVIYTLIGGLWAVLMTDVLQFIILTLVVIMVCSLMLGELDSFSGTYQRLPEGFFSPVAADYGWLFLCGWVAISFFGLGTEWAFVQRYMAVKTPKDAKKSAILFGILYLVTPVIWMLPPLLYRDVDPSANPEQAYVLASQSVLPEGLVGLMFAAMFSATASMVSSQLNVFASVLTNDFYKALIRPNITGKQLVRVGRIITGLIGLILILVALYVPNMGGAERLIISLNSLIVVPLMAPALWGLFSPQIGIKDMFIVVFASFSTGLVLRFGFSLSGGDTDVLVGVVLPITMLIIIQIIKQNRVDKRWNHILACTSRAHEYATVKSDDKAIDFFPQKVVAVSLLVCAISLFVILFIADKGQFIIASFGLCLLLIAFGIHLKIRKVKISR